MADEFSPGTSWGNPVGYIAEAQNLGWSATETLTTFRADGATMSTQSWYRLWGEVADSITRQPATAALDPFALPSAGDYSTWTMGRGGEFVTSVNVYYRDVDTGLVGTQQFLYKSDEAHAPAEAEAAAWADYSDPDAEQQYGRVALGTATKQIYVTQPFRG